MNIGDLYPVIGFILLVLIGASAYFLIERNERVNQLKSSLNKLMYSFNELDEQAKIIVKTDLELNKAQEELARRFNGLDALQKISRILGTTLDENEIFQRLNPSLLTELGFEKYLFLVIDPDQKLQCRVNFGFSKEDLDKTISFLTEDLDFLSSLKEKQNIVSTKTLPGGKSDVAKIFNVRNFVIAPILVQKDILGMIFAGTQSGTTIVTEGDEELISILAGQLGQAVENARLFEELYRARQGLEAKVQERTSQLTLALQEVQRVSKTKSEFISAVSHELRTPLTSIKGYAAILMTGKIGEIPEAVKERLEKINKHSDNLVKLINDLLDIARIESGRVEMNFVQHRILSVIEAVSDLLAPQMKEKNIQFVVETAKSTPEVFMDISQIERVLINLIGNAIKFTPPNGTIRVSAQPEEEKLTIAVSDTGIGIQEEDAARLFHEFYRVDNEINQTVKGSGLGLALAKRIVEAHGGEMWVTSQWQKGSQFSFTLLLQQKTAKGS